MYLIVTGIFGPLPKGFFELLLGRSSWTLKGVQVLPRVIDSDFHGEIKIMVKTVGLHVLPAGTQIAQLLLIPHLQGNAQNKQRNNAKFGHSSSTAFWSAPVTTQRP